MHNLAMTATKFTWTFRFHQFWCIQVHWFQCQVLLVCVCACVRVHVLCANERREIERDNNFVVSSEKKNKWPTKQPTCPTLPGLITTLQPISSFYSQRIFLRIHFLFRMPCSTNKLGYKIQTKSKLFCVVVVVVIFIRSLYAQLTNSLFLFNI